MGYFKRILDFLVDGAAWIAGVATILMMLHVSADVIARNLFNAPLTGTLEIAANYNMVALTFFPLALIAREKGHIIVELFTSWMKPNPRSILDGLIAIISVIYVGMFTWTALGVAIKKTEIRDAKEAGFGFIEVWPGRWFVVAGFSLLLLYFAWNMVSDLYHGFSGKAERREADRTRIPSGEEML